LLKISKAFFSLSIGLLYYEKFILTNETFILR